MSNQVIKKNVVMSYEESYLSIADFINQRKILGERSEVSLILGIKDYEVLSRFEREEAVMQPTTMTLFLLIADKHPAYILKPVTIEDIPKPLLIPPPNGNEIKQMRNKIKKAISKNFTQSEMSDLLRLTGKSLISNYEKGLKKPSIQTWTVFLLASSQHPFYELHTKIV